MKCTLILSMMLALGLSATGQSNFTCPNTANDLCREQLAEYLKPVATRARVVGLGEATHGTREFCLIKSEIVRQLVTHYGYRYFLLEASYLDGQRINDFIHGKSVDSLSLFAGIPWPWATEEFYDLLLWMRKYNAGVKDSQSLVFIGSDLGTTGTIRILSQSYANAQADSYPKNVLNIFGDSLMTTKEKIKYFDRQLAGSIPGPAFRDTLARINLLETLKFLLLKGGRKYKYREERFSGLTQRIVNRYPNEKFVVWAHNGHITRKNNERQTLGHFLDQAYAAQYINFGFDFKQGCFRAADIDSNRYENNVFKLNSFCVETSPQNLASSMADDAHSYSILNLRQPENHERIPAVFNIRSVGAVYGTALAKEKPSLYLEKVFRDQSFDYLIFVDRSGPSKGKTR